MKNLKLFIALTLSFLLVATTNAATIEKIDVKTNNTIDITASSDVVFSDVNVEGDIKVLKDLAVSFSSKDPENTKKLLLNLSEDLSINTSYSLITILWAEGNIDFVIWESLEWEILNLALAEWENGIEKINILDSRTMELYFNFDLTEDLFEFKILTEIPTSSLKSEWNNLLTLQTSRNLSVNTDYILMILTLEDAMGSSIVFEEDLYDVTTPSNLEEAIAEEEAILAAAEEEVEVIEEGNVEEVALTTDTTPETWTATSVLILLAILANLAFFFRKKIFSK